MVNDVEACDESRIKIRSRIFFIVIFDAIFVCVKRRSATSKISNVTSNILDVKPDRGSFSSFITTTLDYEYR